MKAKRLLTPLLIICLGTSASLWAEDKIELKTIKIKGNKELPKILYVVPWQETEKTIGKDQKLQLHDFFGDLYDPMTPAPPKTALEREGE